MDVIVFASSSTDAGIGCWDLRTGAEHLRYKSCASPSHGLASVGNRFLASSQLRDPSASSGSILYWSFSKPQVELKSFPENPIKPIAANSEGTYIVGGGSSGDIYLWEVATGRLLKKWHGHLGAVTCLVFSEDDSLLVSGSQDGNIRVWSLLKVLDDTQKHKASHLYEHSFTEHTRAVTDIVMGYGGCNSIIVSASEDQTCKVWSLSKGILLRNVRFPAAIDAIVLDPGEHVFYAGSRDGKIYFAALNAGSPSVNNGLGMHILGSLSVRSKVTCLAYSSQGNLLLSGSEDGMVRVWEPATHNLVRMFRHGKGPVNNVLVTQPLAAVSHNFSNSQSSSRNRISLPPPLEKFENRSDEFVEDKVIVSLSTCDIPVDTSYHISRVMHDQIEQLQKQGSGATEMEVQTLKLECKRYMEMAQQCRKMYENLHEFTVNELLDKDQA